MLTSLNIKNVVLIESLSLSFDKGLYALTGETGAGKSILLDSLGLALGARAESGLVRHGTDQAVVSAVFENVNYPIVIELLSEQGVRQEEDNLILRRVLTSDGRSKAFINDQAVSISFLRQIGDMLVEIHGQFESHGLMDAKTHLPVLDTYGGLIDKKSQVKMAWNTYIKARKKRDDLRAEVEKAHAEKDYLRHCVKELEKLSPEAGEVEKLQEARSFLMNREKVISAVNAAYAYLGDDEGAYTQLSNAQGEISRAVGFAENQLGDVCDILDRLVVETEDVLSTLQSLGSSMGTDIEMNPDEIEERLFALKDCARKHHCEIDQLPEIKEQLEEKLNIVENQDSCFKELDEIVEKSRVVYLEQAQDLSEKRQDIANKLDNAVNTELVPLKMEKAVFSTSVVQKAEDESHWGSDGIDNVGFLVSTNPGAPAGPLGKIASGGELSRFMLALKVVLAETGSIETLIFDEVDSGVGGAVADAVGERLARLSEMAQILVVTHSPQVAASAQGQYKVSKEEKDGKVITSVDVLTNEERLEEIARMLSGAEVTTEARAAAASLMGVQDVAA